MKRKRCRSSFSRSPKVERNVSLAAWDSLAEKFFVEIVAVCGLEQ